MTQTTVNQRIKFLIDALNLSSRAFSRSLDVPDATTRNYIEGRSKPGFEYLEKLMLKYTHVNSMWLLTGEGEMFTSETKASQTQQIGKNKGQAIGTNNGHATMNFNSIDDCQRELTSAQRENETLRSQLQDKERIIQLLEMQLKK